MKNEDLIRDAVRAQILSEIMHGGGGGGSRPPREEMADSIVGGMAPEDWDYYVDIERRDLPELNEATGKPIGWQKKVHRFTSKKGTEPPPPGKKRKGSR